MRLLWARLMVAVILAMVIYLIVQVARGVHAGRWEQIVWLTCLGFWVFQAQRWWERGQ